MNNPTTSSTEPGDPSEVWRREYDAALQAAIEALTAGARLRRPVLEQVEDAEGNHTWRSHPTKTEQADWAEFVTRAVAGAAANVGSVEAALAGRPGSWEAESVRSMVASTAGGDPAQLLEHRTEPVRVRVAAAALLEELMDVSGLYDESQQILEAAWEDAEAALEGELDERRYVWEYRVEHHQGVRTMVPLEEDAPPFDEQRWREDLVALGVPAESIAAIAEQLEDPNSFITAVSVSRDDAARPVLVDLDARRRAAEAPHVQRIQALEDQQTRELSEYAQRLQAEIEAEAARRFGGVQVVVDVDLDPYAVDEPGEYVTPEYELLEHARMHTPLPGSGLAPIEYPPTVPIVDVEREAGRLPHARLQTESGE